MLSAFRKALTFFPTYVLWFLFLVLQLWLKLPELYWVTVVRVTILWNDGRVNQLTHTQSIASSQCQPTSPSHAYAPLCSLFSIPLWDQSLACRGFWIFKDRGGCLVFSHNPQALSIVSYNQTLTVQGAGSLVFILPAALAQASNRQQ